MGKQGAGGPKEWSQRAALETGEQWGGRATKMGQEGVGERGQAGYLAGAVGIRWKNPSHILKRHRFRSDTGLGVSCRESGGAGTAEGPPPSATLLRACQPQVPKPRTGQSIAQVPRDWLCPPVLWASQLRLQLMVKAFSQEGVSQGVIRVS